MSRLFDSSSLSSLEAVAALLLLDSDDLDSFVVDEIQKLEQTLKQKPKEQEYALQPCAYRIKEEDKEKILNDKTNKKRKISETKYSSEKMSDVKSKIHGYWLSAARTPIFAESFLPKMTETDYKTHFGLTPTQIEKLFKLIKPFYVQNEKQKNLESFVLAGLASLATQKSYREIGLQLSRSKGHVCVWSQRFNSILSEKFTYLIKWPEEGVSHIVSKFKEICGFPGVVGAFGACHIPLKHASQSTDACFKNNKGFYSLVLSATCDHNMSFTSLSIDTPANFQSTNGMSNRTIQALMTNSFSLMDDASHVLAGPGFPLCNQILTPYLKSGDRLTSVQLNFNNKLDETRKIILRAFSALRKRFHRLHVIDSMDFSRAAAAIVAACVLHNFALEDEEEEGEEEDDEEGEDFENLRRKISFEIEDVIQIDSNEDPLCVKRERIAHSLLKENFPT